MTDFLARLAERQLTPAPGVAPRLPSRFAPPLPPPVEPGVVLPIVAGARDPTPPAPVAVTRAQARNDEARAPTPLVKAEAGQVRTDPEPVPEASPPAPEPPYAATARKLVERVPVPMEIQAVEHLVPTPPTAREAVSTAATPPSKAASPPPAADGTDPYPRPHSPQPLVPRGPDLPVLLSATVPAAAARVEAGEPPVVKVTIGRVEVRAVMPPPTARERPSPIGRKAMSLEEYLERRYGSRR